MDSLDSRTLGLLGADIIGACATLLGTLFSNLFQLLREQLQWNKQQEIERQKWIRDKLQEIYSNCIFYITAYIEPNNSTVFEDWAKAKKWLNILLVYSPDRSTTKFEILCAEIENFCSSLDIEQAKRLRNRIIEIAATAPRLHGG